MKSKTKPQTNNETQKLQSGAEGPYSCAHLQTLADSSGLK